MLIFGDSSSNKRPLQKVRREFAAAQEGWWQDDAKLLGLLDEHRGDHAAVLEHANA